MVILVNLESEMVPMPMYYHATSWQCTNDPFEELSCMGQGTNLCCVGMILLFSVCMHCTFCFCLVKKTTTATSAPKQPAPKKDPPKQQSVGFNPDDILKVKLGKKKQPGPPPPPPPPPPEETKSSDPDWAPKNYIEKGMSLVCYV